MSLKSAKVFTAIVVILGSLLSILILMNEKETHDIQKQRSVISKVKYTEDSLQKKIDSLQSDLFQCEVELERYKVAYKILMSRNPEAARQYGEIMTFETE